MKFFLSTVLMLTTCFSFADTYVHGYTRSNGTYVQPHYRSSPDNTVSNNWSTQGNLNPHTGAYGTRRDTGSNPFGHSQGDTSRSLYEQTQNNSDDD